MANWTTCWWFLNIFTYLPSANHNHHDGHDYHTQMDWKTKPIIPVFVHFVMSFNHDVFWTLRVVRVRFSFQVESSNIILVMNITSKGNRKQNQDIAAIQRCIMSFDHNDSATSRYVQLRFKFQLKSFNITMARNVVPM